MEGRKDDFMLLGEGLSITGGNTVWVAICVLIAATMLWFTYAVHTVAGHAYIAVVVVGSVYGVTMTHRQSKATKEKEARYRQQV